MRQRQVSDDDTMSFWRSTVLPGAEEPVAEDTGDTVSDSDECIKLVQPHYLQNIIAQYWCDTDNAE